MYIESKPCWKTLCCLVAAGSFLGGVVESNAEDMAEGIAVATSIKGSVQIEDAESHSTQPKLHDTLILNACTVETGKNAHIFLALSNGMGIGIGENSAVRFETFIQKPFTEKSERLSYEPSKSILSVRLINGDLAVVSNNLSPLSEARVFLPTGELQIHSATCIIQYNDMGAQITAYSGLLTYKYPDRKQRELIINPQSIRISPQSAMLGEVTESTTLSSLPQAIELFSQATQHASERVFFKAGKNGHPPRPVLIASPGHLDQPVSRPYEFNK
jgi:hypothetical protein